MRRCLVVAMGIIGFLLLVGGGTHRLGAAVAIDSLDLRVDSLTPHMLLNLPAQALLDPQRQKAALRYESLAIPGRVAVYLLAAVALLWFWRSGASARFRDRIRRRVRSEVMVRMLFSASAALLVRLAELPAQFYLYRVERSMDLISSLTPAWFLQWAIVTCIWMACAALALASLLWLADRSHMWYIPALLGVALVVVLVSLLSGLGNASSDKFRAYQPTMVGLGPTLHVIVPGEFRRTVSSGEYRFAMERIAIEKATHQQARRMVLLMILILVTLSSAIGISDRIVFRRDDDPLTRVVVAAAILAFLALPAHMIYVGYMRADVLRVDQLAQKNVGHPAESIRLLVREADRTLEPATLSSLEIPFTGGMPEIATRIAAIRLFHNVKKLGERV